MSDADLMQGTIPPSSRPPGGTQRANRMGVVGLVLGLLGLLPGVAGLLIFHQGDDSPVIHRGWSLHVLFVSALLGAPGHVLAILAVSRVRRARRATVAALILTGLHVAIGISFWFPLGPWLWKSALRSL